MTSAESKDRDRSDALTGIIETDPLVPVILASDAGERSNAIALPASLILPKLIANAGEKASWRFINFFTAEIENDNTRNHSSV